MIVDTSALVAVLLRESGFESVVTYLESADALAVGAPTVTETSLVLSGRLGRDARSKVARLLQEYEIVVVPFTAAHSEEAVEAFMRFGKGRHPAGLNFGDCLAYAVARLADQPLLCRGRDFSQTDLDMVIAV